MVSVVWIVSVISRDGVGSLDNVGMASVSLGSVSKSGMASVVWIVSVSRDGVGKSG